MSKATKSKPSEEGKISGTLANSTSSSNTQKDKLSPDSSDKPLITTLPAIIPRPVISYLTEQVSLQKEALKPFETNPVEDAVREPEIKKMREVQAMIIRDRITELNRHIAVIQRIAPNS